MENGKIKVWLPAIRVNSGTDVFTRRLADALTKRGIAAQISWFSGHYELMPFLLRDMSPPEGTDVIFANSWNGFAFKRTSVPLIVIVHHSGFNADIHSYRSLAQHIYHRLLIKPFEMRSFQAADRITAVSTFSADGVRHFFGSKTVETIHNWIDTERFHPVTENSVSSSKPFRLLFVGKVSRLKGADILVEIMRQLGDSFELRIAGRAKSGKNLDYPHNMHLLGWLNEEELIHAYQNCDALLFPSRSEGFGYAALEAMACGKPVIASNTTALPEVVSNDVTGILCSPGDVTAFVKACRKLNANRALCVEMGKAARERAVKYFSEEAMLEKYMLLIRDTIHSR